MKFALDICTLIRTLPGDEPGPTVKRQLTKSSTSTAANYRAACRARSHAEFTSKMGLVAEEADENVFWLEYIAGANLTKAKNLPVLETEGRELLQIFSRSVGTARLNERQQ